MRHSRLFAAAFSAALLVGVASPAMATPGKGHAYGHSKPKHKPAKDKPAGDAEAPKTKTGVNGGGVTANGADFSIQVRQANLKKGHFNYTSADGAWKVRCRGFDSYSPLEYVAAGPAGAHVTAQCVEIQPHHSRPSVALDATFVDNGETGDQATITLTRPGTEPFTDSGPITEGSVQVR